MGTTNHASGLHQLTAATHDACRHDHQSMVLRRVSGSADVLTLMCVRCNKWSDTTLPTATTILVSSHGQVSKQ